MKITITGNINKTYDKIFKIIDAHVLFIKCETYDEKQIQNGYELYFDNIPHSALEIIEDIKNVDIEY